MRKRAAIIGIAFLFALSGSDAFRADMGDRSAGAMPDDGVAPSRLGLHPPFRPRPSAPRGEPSRPGGSPTTYGEPERAKAVTPAVAGKGFRGSSPGRITPSPSPIGKRPAVTTKPDTASTLSGIASWFRSPINVSAAGPALRERYPDWRGMTVLVCRLSICIETVLGDWCACPKRLIDLDDGVFAGLAPLSRGLVRVEVSG